MTTVADVAAWVEEFAPSRLAEPWDNVGLLWGDPESVVDKLLTCLTVTPEVVAEAVENRADVVVSHHPVLFKAVKSVRADRPGGATLWRLARADIAIISPHTAFDNTVGGINDILASLLGLVDVGPLRLSPPSTRYKVVVFAPVADRGPILEAAFAAGAGQVGNYVECSYSGPGAGTFLGAEGTNPTVGLAGRRESVRERRVEMPVSADRLAAVLAAIRSRHSYEEPAIDVYPLRPEPEGPGIGRVGRLPAAETLSAFAARVSAALTCPAPMVVGTPGRRIERVAIACGAGDDFLGDAIRGGADALLTGEARYHRAIEAEEAGIALILAGHHATERPGVECLASLIAAAFPDLAVWASRAERDPLRMAP